MPNLVHGFCGRAGGISSGPFASLNLSARVGDDPTAVGENWRRVSMAAGQLPFAGMRQVHGTEVVCVADPAADIGEADALVTNTSGVALGILTADCVPILLVAAEAHAVAAVHAGWRGTLAGIAERAVHTLSERCGVSPEQIHAALGPAISGCCYEVDAPIADQMEARWGSMPDAVMRTGGAKAFIDLRRINCTILSGTGIPPTAVTVIGPCTHCEAAHFFSHRAAMRQGSTTGRQLSFIGWRNLDCDEPSGTLPDKRSEP